MKKIGSIGILIFLFTTVSKAQEDLSHLRAFAKVYGYVKYFQPSTEVTKIDWDKFSAYGLSLLGDGEIFRHKDGTRIQVDRIHHFNDFKNGLAVNFVDKNNKETTFYFLIMTR